MCFSMLQKLLWRKGEMCSTCLEPACSCCPGGGAKREGPVGQLQPPPSAPVLLILEGYINTRLSALLDGGLLAEEQLKLSHTGWLAKAAA